MDLTYRRMLLLMAATLASLVVGVSTSAASGEGAIGGPDYCAGRGLVVFEEGVRDSRELLTEQQHEPQDGTAQVTGREPAGGHC